MSAPNTAENGTLTRVRYNVIPLVDIALGRFERGKDGLTYLNGGMSKVMGFGGRGNVFKTFLMSYLSWCMFIRYRLEWLTFYDTEESAEAQRQNDVLRNVLLNNGHDVDPLGVYISEYLRRPDETPEQFFKRTGKKQTFSMSNISKLSGTNWFNEWIKDPSDDREKIFKSNKQRKTTPFFNIFGEYESVLPPWVHQCDSLSEWHSDANIKESFKADVGESESNHLSAQDYNHKAQMIQKWPILAGKSESIICFTVQITDDISMGRDMGGNDKKLDVMKGKVKLAGVPSKQITYLTNSLLIATNSKELNHDYNAATGSTTPMFPNVDAKGQMSSYNDLKLTRYQQWRAKSGPTGINLYFIFSQEEGLQVGLSEWYYLKEVMGKSPWGWKRSGNFYSLDILPDVKFQRTTVRTDVVTDRKLARAMSITAQCCYLLNNTVRLSPDMRMSGDELFTRITELGYDWDEILEKTQDWWCFLEDAKDKSFQCKETLTVWTLLEMAADKFHPKFLTRNLPKAA